MDSNNAALMHVKDALEKHAFIRGSTADIVSRRREFNENGWLFDLRNILLESGVMENVASLFWTSYKKKTPIQIGSIETGGIALVAALVYGGRTGSTQEDISGFFIRKSRKKDGLMKMIEGQLRSDRPIILVDDLINSGKSMMRQVEVVEAAGGKVAGIWTVLRFRDINQYQYFTEKGIEIRSLFTLDDFKDTLGTSNLLKKESQLRTHPFKVLWKFSGGHPNYHHVVPKSDPIVDDEHVYVGSDEGFMQALSQSDGALAWSYKIGRHPKRKGIFSSPALWDETLYFGGYDGNFYALDAKTGKRKWISFEADWIGSSPTVAPDLGLVFVGMEFGLFRKRGGIIALDAKTGAKKWSYYEMPCLTHSSPMYIQERRQVVIGSNDGCAYLFDARTGNLLWKFQTGILDESEMDAGFSRFDIKESFAYDPRRDLLIFGNSFGELFFVDRITGKETARFKAEFGFYSTPVVYKNTILVSSLDKHLYCVDLDTFQERWRWNAGARIFATPIVIDASIYIGANTGRFTELDAETGNEKSFLVLTERITNKAAYNPITKHFFVPTFANELYCVDLER